MATSDSHPEFGVYVPDVTLAVARNSVQSGLYSAILEALYLDLHPDYKSWGCTSRDLITQWYYVDATASGGGSGSEAAPWTLAEAWAANLQPGKGVRIKPGNYTQSTAVTLQQSGTAQAPIWFVADDITSMPVINGGGTGYVLTQQNAYIGIYGLEITNMPGVGFGQGADGIETHHITVESCYFHDIEGEGGNNIAALRMDKVSKSVFRNNLIVNITSSNAQDDGHAWETYQGENNLFEHNEVINAKTGFYIKLPTANLENGHIVRRNIFKDIRGAFFEIYGNSGEPQVHDKNIVAENLSINAPFTDLSRELNIQPRNLYMVNNTIIGAGWSVDGHASFRCWNNIVDGRQDGTDLNILIRPGWLAADYGQDYGVTEVVKVDYNCYPKDVYAYDQSAGTNYNGLASWQSAPNSTSLNLSPAGPDANAFVADPMYANAASDDYSLSTGSPCIGAGEGGDNVGAYATQGSVIGRLS